MVKPLKKHRVHSGPNIEYIRENRTIEKRHKHTHKYKQARSIEQLIEENPNYIKDIEPAQQTKELRLLALKYDSHVIKYLDNPSDEEILYAIRRKATCLMYLSDVKFEYKQIAVALDPRLIVIDDELNENEDEVIKALIAAPDLIEHQKIRIRMNQNIADRITDINPYALIYLDRTFLTDNLKRKCLQHDGMLLKYIEEDEQDQELIEVALKQKNPDEPYSTVGEFIKLWNKDIAELAVKMNPHNLEFIPKTLYTLDLFETALSNDGSAIEHIYKLLGNYHIPNDLDELFDNSENARLKMDVLENDLIRRQRDLDENIEHKINSVGFKAVIKPEVYGMTS